MKRKYGIWLAIAVFLALMALPLLTGAEDTYADSNVIEVSTLAELRSAVQKEGAYVVLKNDITSAERITMEINADYVTLDLGNYWIRNTYPCKDGNDIAIISLVQDCENVKILNGHLYGEGDHCRVFELHCGNIEIEDLSTWGGSFLSCWLANESTCRVTRCGFSEVSDVADSSYAGIYSGHMGRIVLDDVNLYVRKQYGIGIYGDDPRLELVKTKIYGDSQTALFTRITGQKTSYDTLLTPLGELYVDGVQKTGQIPQTTLGSNQVAQFRGQTLETKAGPLFNINSVSVSITPPAAGARPDYKPTFGADTYYNDLYHEDGFRSSIIWIDQTTGKEVDPQEGKFIGGHEYAVSIFLSAEPGYELSGATTAKVNGESATAAYKSAYHQLEVMYTFPAAQNPKDLGMLTVNVKNGAATLIGLPGYYLYQQFLGSLYQLDIIGGFTMFGDSYHPIAIDLDNDGSFDVWTEEQGISGGHEINNYKITFYKLPTCSVKSSKTLYLPKFLEDNMQDMDDVTGNPLHYYSKVKFLFDDTVKAKFVVENTCVSTPYTGTARKPDSISVTLVAGNYKLDWWNPLYHVSYRNNVNVGTAQIIVGIAPSDTVVKKTFQITPVNLAAAATKTSVSGIKASYAYTGKAIKPTPTVKALVGGATKTLKAGTDYTVKYTNNTNVGTATVTITGKGNFKGTVKKTFKITSSKPGFDRLSGADRYATSRAIADAYKKQLGVTKFSAVCIADGQNYPDALAGAYFAGCKSAPILVVHQQAPTGDKSMATINYVKANLPAGKTVYILGGPGSVPDVVVTMLTKAGYKVERLWGQNRYGSNLAILKKAQVPAGTDFIVCTGAQFADALSASATGKPVLLVAGNKLTEDQKAYLKGVKAKSFTIVGTASDVAPAIETELKTYAPVTRLNGADIYTRSIQIAKKFFPATVSHINLADGRNFPDALCGGPLAQKLSGPLLLTDGSAAVNEKMKTYATGAKTIKATVFGGPASVTDATVKYILSMN